MLLAGCSCPLHLSVKYLGEGTACLSCCHSRIGPCQGVCHSHTQGTIRHASAGWGHFKAAVPGRWRPFYKQVVTGKGHFSDSSCSPPSCSSCQHLDTLEGVLSENTKCGRHLEVDYFLDVHLDLSFSNKQRFIFDHKPKCINWKLSSLMALQNLNLLHLIEAMQRTDCMIK